MSSWSGRFIGHPTDDVVEGGTKFLVLLADFNELGGDSVDLGGDGYDT